MKRLKQIIRVWSGDDVRGISVIGRTKNIHLTWQAPQSSLVGYGFDTDLDTYKQHIVTVWRMMLIYHVTLRSIYPEGDWKQLTMRSKPVTIPEGRVGPKVHKWYLWTIRDDPPNFGIGFLDKKYPISMTGMKLSADLIEIEWGERPG